MRIVVAGTRGFPGVQGGVETHCERLYPRIAASGHEVIVMRRKPYIYDDAQRGTRWPGIRFIDISSPRSKAVEAFVHTLCAVVRARFLNPDIIHIHAVGPSLFVPLARLLGMRVVATNHGADYEREKWGRFAKFALRLGERLQCGFSNEVISISPAIVSNLSKRYGRQSTLIFNGVDSPLLPRSGDYLHSLGVEPGKYIFALGRFVREKNFHMLAESFANLAPAGYKLVIAGAPDHHDAYSEFLLDRASELGVVLPGFVKGEPLAELFANAALFVMPSSHEGLPIALLEAMSYGLDVLVSDIEACRLKPLSEDDFFSLGREGDLERGLRRKLISPRRRTYDLRPYNWDEIAGLTIDIYRKAAK